MSDGKRGCLGFVFLAAALGLSFIFGVATWVNQDLRSGAIIGFLTFAVFAVASAYMFISIKDYAWLPAVFGGVYALLPDLILGPGDDFGVLLIGTILTGILSWRRSRNPQLPK